MMKRHWLIPITAALLTGLAQGLPASGEGDAPADVIVTNADATKQVNVVASAPLQSLLGTLLVRVAFNYADANKTVTMANTPPALNALFAQISARIVHNYTDASYVLPLSFPRAVVNDTVPPQVPQQVSSGPVNGQIVLRWTSAEFTKATVAYGTQSGNYAFTVSENEFATQHSIVLTNIASGTPVFLKITQVDLSGNSGASGEYKLTSNWFVHLPIVRR
jgi:hypothetical protein